MMLGLKGILPLVPSYIFNSKVALLLGHRFYHSLSMPQDIIINGGACEAGMDDYYISIVYILHGIFSLQILLRHLSNTSGKELHKLV